MAKAKRYVVVRTARAGVHVGTLVSRTGMEVVLADTSRVWNWYGANTLHEMSLNGVEERSRISAQIKTNTLTEVIEVLDCTSKAAANLSRPRWS